MNGYSTQSRLKCLKCLKRQAPFGVNEREACLDHAPPLIISIVFQRWIYHTMGLKKVVDRIGIVLAYWEEVLSVTDLGPGILSGTELATAAFCLRQLVGWLVG
jgi:hypothetical protein